MWFQKKNEATNEVPHPKFRLMESYNAITNETFYYIEQYANFGREYSTWSICGLGYSRKDVAEEAFQRIVSTGALNTNKVLSEYP